MKSYTEVVKNNLRGWRKLGVSAVAALSAAAMLLALPATSATAQQGERTDSPAQSAAGAQKRHFMVYYRAWRDKTMKGVNTSLPDENWITMDDIPYGVDVVNVFSYVPAGQEAQAQPFFDKLKSDYAPNLHARGVKLVRGFGYDNLLQVPHAGAEPTEAEYLAYAKQLKSELMDAWGLDGLDIDMEQHPSAEQVRLSDGVIKALSTLIGPKAHNGTMLLYDTNGSYLAPLRNVSDCFDYVAYQQYGDDATRTASAVRDYQGLIGKNRFVPGLTFPEEQDQNNRWLDAVEPFGSSHINSVASYVRDQNLGGMFLYAPDRDGRTYEDADLNHILPSTMLWTKTAIAQSQGMSLEEAKGAARHYLTRMGFTTPASQDVFSAVSSATNIYEVNKALLGPDYAAAYSKTYDPTLERQLESIDLGELTTLIDKADSIVDSAATKTADEDLAALRSARDAAVQGIAAKSYTQVQVDGWVRGLNAALQPYGSNPSDPSKPGASTTPKPVVSKPAGHAAAGKADGKDHGNGSLAKTGSSVAQLTAVVCGLLLAAGAVVLAGRRRVAK